MTDAADGVLVLDKPAGCTSHDVVAQLRRLAGTRKVGHAGTLDPLATGVLVVGLGRATRLLGHLSGADKAYDATVRLGQSTVTDDAEGELLAEADVGGVTDTAIRAAAAALTGHLMQRPSAVSAVKVAGRRAYARVRGGEQVELAARPVVVSELSVLAVRRSGRLLDLDVHVECSTGTYVRALARDLGAALGVGGHLTALRRVRVGPYRIHAAHPLEGLVVAEALLTPAQVAADFFPTYALDPEQADDVRHGRPLRAALPADGLVAVLGPDRDLLALYERRGDLGRAVAVFASGAEPARRTGADGRRAGRAQ